MILLRRRPDGLVGVVTPPHSASVWTFDEPIADEAFRNRMDAEGCHSTDVWDAMSEAERQGFGYLP
jgi:hypothetical protein